MSSDGSTSGQRPSGAPGARSAPAAARSAANVEGERMFGRRTPLLCLGALLGGLGAGASGCSDPGPDVSAIQVTFVTTGSHQDPDGYAITIPTQPGKFPRPNDTVTFEDLASGAHSILVTGINENCAINGQNVYLQTVTLEAEEIAEITLDVICEPMRAGVVVLEGSQEHGGDGTAVTLRLRNDGGPGTNRIEFWRLSDWRLSASSEEAPMFLAGSEEVEVDENYDEMVTHELATKADIDFVLIYTNNESNPGFGQTGLFQF
jgi:hypothetical protein